MKLYQGMWFEAEVTNFARGTPKKSGRAKNVQNSVRFLTTFNFDGRQFLFRQALFRQALFRQALFRHFTGLLM